MATVRLLYVLTTPVVALVVGACGAGATAIKPPSDEIRLSIDAGEEQIIDMRTGKRVDFEQMADALATAEVVYVGERHNYAEDHAVQYAVLDALIKRSGRVALGMEMFQYPFQGYLDRWADGEFTARKMLRLTEYEKRWGYNFDFYQPLMEAAKRSKSRIIAINAPMEVTRAVAHGGLQSLDPVQVAELPELRMNDKSHRKLIDASMDKNVTMDEETAERFYATQVIWDETMAHQVAKLMTGPDAPDHLLVLAGKLRVQGGVGIPKRAERRGVSSWKSVIPVSDDDPLTRWRGAPQDRPADFLWVVPKPPDM